MATLMEAAAMRRAIALSAAGIGTTSPNPPVGCVLLDQEGRVIGEGYHQRKGEAHAETHALAAAGGQARGATAVVTLEPCNHEGRTPACRQALIDAKVARVVIALLDPTSRSDGGAATLRAAGIDVEAGVLADEARVILGPWLTALERQRPVITWPYVVSAGGSKRRPARWTTFACSGSTRTRFFTLMAASPRRCPAATAPGFCAWRTPPWAPRLQRSPHRCIKAASGGCCLPVT